MPELPEVETTRRALEPALLGRRVVAVEHVDPDRYRDTRLAVGRTVTGVDRRGKYLIVRLDETLGEPGLGEHGLDAIVHLKMTGGFRFPGASGSFESPPRFERLRLRTDVGEVSFVDSRRFGIWRVVPRGEHAGIEALRTMGPEPLTDDFRPDAFAEAMARTTRVKPALLGQRIVAGLGNIYADEALWEAGLHPEAGRLSREQSERLHAAIRNVLSRAVKAGGSTLSDATYQQPDGQSGYFQHQHRAYGQDGRPCERCGTIIMKYRLAQRGTHYCPVCQAT